MNVSATLNCQTIIKQRIKDGLPVYNFGLGANPIKQPEFYINKLKQYADRKEYTSSEGIPELNSILLDQYSKNNYANKVLIGNGLKELIFIIQSAFDGKIFHITPSWISYKEQISLLNKQDDLIEIETTIENNYRINLEELEQKLNDYKNDKLIIRTLDKVFLHQWGSPGGGRRRRTGKIRTCKSTCGKLTIHV